MNLLYILPLLMAGASCAVLNATRFAECVGLPLEALALEYQNGTGSLILHPIDPSDYDDDLRFDCLAEQDITNTMWIGDGTYLEDMGLQSISWSSVRDGFSPSKIIVGPVETRSPSMSASVRRPSKRSLSERLTAALLMSYLVKTNVPVVS